MQNRLQRLLKKVTLKVFIVALLFILALFLFAFIAHEAVAEHEDAFDMQVHQFFVARSTPALVHLMEDFTFLGSSTFLFPAYIVLILFFVVKKSYRRAIDIAIIAFSSFLLMQGLKQVFHRKRPDLPIIKGVANYSFPSGHSLSSFIFCSILGYLIWKGKMRPVYKVLLIIALLLLAVTIGISRIVLNVHYATDVIAGFCLGVMWVIVSFIVIRSINYGKVGKQ